MTTRLVDVFDPNGAKLFTYNIALEEDGCLDGEFEEAALIFAESSGLVAADEIALLHARCNITASEDSSEQRIAQPMSRRRKSPVVSLVKHRMKRAHAGMPGQARVLLKR